MGMTISDSIRELAREGHSTADIARRLGIRYQHVYNVLRTDRTRRAQPAEVCDSSVLGLIGPTPSKPQLRVDTLVAGGFSLAGRWTMSDDNLLVLDRPMPAEIGVYAFAKADVVHYVGVATMGLARRLYFYAKPGITQRTSQRLNKVMKEELQATPSIDIYVAIPPDLEWNGLPVHGSAGLELGLIKKFHLPWNMRSAR